MWTEHPLEQHICARTGLAHRSLTHTLREHAWLKRTAQSCMHWCLKKVVVIHAQCPTYCRTCHRTLPHDLSHLPRLSSDHLLPHCLVLLQLLRDWIKIPCEIHDGVADTPNLHLPQVMRKKLIQSDEYELQGIELDRNIGTDPYQIPDRILGDVYQNLIKEYTEETRKCGVDMPYSQSRIHSDYDSAERIADSDLEDGELRKMLASPMYVHGRRENYGSSHKPTASGKPEAKIMQKRGASAQRTQADHSRRESKKSNPSQEPRASWKTGCSVFINKRRTGKSV